MGLTGPTGDHPVPGVSIPYSTKFSLSQIYSLLIANGATPQAAHDLTQISTREDGSGTVNIVNDTPSTGDYSVGFFQLNLLDGNGHIMPSRNFGNGQVYSAQQLAADPNLQAKAAIALWNNGNGQSNWTPSYLGPQARWWTNTNSTLADQAQSNVGNEAIAIANGALALIGLPPIDPSVPPQNPTSGNTSGAGGGGSGGFGDGSGDTTTPGTGGSTGTTTNTSGLGVGQVELGTIAGQLVTVPSGMVLAALAVVLLLLGAILFLANNQSIKAPAQLAGATANPAVQVASKVLP